MMKNEKPVQLYNASAGSGKTYSLVKNYLKKILQSNQKDYFKHILAVTFTNKAANEMKSRLVKTLNDMASEKYRQNEMLQDLSKELEIPIEELHEKAKTRLKTILHHYSLLSFYTLDKFSLRLLKSFSKELNLSYNFTVEIDPKEYYEEAFLQFKDSFEENNTLFQSILNFYFNALDEEKNLWYIDQATIEELFSYDSENNLKFIERNAEMKSSDIAQLRRKLWKEQKQIPKEIQNLALESLDIIAQNGLDHKDFNGGARSGLKKIFENIRDKNVEGNTYFNRFDKFEEDSWLAQKNISQLDLLQRVVLEVREKYEQLNLFYQKYVLNKSVIDSLFPLQVYQKVKILLFDLKTEDDLVFINEFKPLISQHLREQPSAFIFEKLGNRYEHIFFDEFQDTSQLEWDNFQPLVQNITSQATHQTVSIIGDPKQSIYRFKGGNPEIMMDIIEQVETKPEIIQDNPLKTNYRSTANIVNFNNRLYQYLSGDFSTPLYEKLFGEMGQQTPKNTDNEGVVKFFVLNQQDYKEREREKIYALIEDAQRRNIPLSEVAILVQKNAEAQELVTFLLGKNPELEIATEESLLLCKNEAVQALISIAYLVQNEKDNTQLFNLIYALSQCSTLFEAPLEEELLAIFENPATAFSVFQKKIGIQFSELYAQSTDLYNWFETLIQKLSFTQNFQNYLIHFLDAIYELENQHTVDIQNFIQFWQEKGERLKIIAPENKNALNIMTVHKSKGLEFKVVILPDIKENSRDELWIPLGELYGGLAYNKVSLSTAKQIQDLQPEIKNKIEERELQNQVDEMCRYYVATTRTEEELYLFLNFNNKNKWSQYLVAEHYMPQPITAGSNKNSDTFEDMEIDLFPEVSPKIYPPFSKDINHKNQIPYAGFPWKGRLKIAQEFSSAFDPEGAQKGNQLHTLLEHIKYAHQVEAVLEAAQRDGFIEPKDFPLFYKKLEMVVHHPLLAPYFSTEYQVYIERSILFEGQMYRPDRLVRKENIFTIIDYKTGNQHEKDRLQIKEYQNLLKQLGFEVEKCMLVYIHENSIDCVTL